MLMKIDHNDSFKLLWFYQFSVIVYGSFVPVKFTWAVSAHVLMIKGCKSDPIFHMSVFRCHEKPPTMQVFHFVLSLSQYSSPYTGVELFFEYLLWVQLQLQLHQCCYRSSCCQWMYRAAAPEPGSNCWTPIRHDAESGRNVWSDVPPSCFSLKTIEAFQITIWNERTRNVLLLWIH